MLDRKLYQYAIVVSGARNQDEMRAGKRGSVDHEAGCKKCVACASIRSQHWKLDVSQQGEDVCK